MYHDVPEILGSVRAGLSGQSSKITVELSGVTFDAYYEPVRDEKGEVTGVVGIGADVTDQKLAEKKLTESEDRLRSVIENAVDGIFVIDSDGRVLEINQRACDDLGYTRGEMIGMSVEVFSPIVTPEVLARVFEQITSEGPLTLEQVHQRSDGTTYPAEVRVGFLQWNEGKCLICVARDVSERKRVQRAMEQSEQRFRTVFEFSPIGIVEVDDEGTMGLSNRAFQEMLGYGKDELQGKRFTEFTHANDLREDLSLFGELVAGTRDHYGFRKRYFRKDGSIVWADIVVARLPAAMGDFRCIALVIDATQQRHLQEQLLQAQKMEAVGQLAGGVAHDFNNLLSAVLGYSQLALAQLSPEDRLHSFLEEIQKAGERAAALTRQLLVFSRRQITAPRVIDLNDLIVELGNMVRRTIGEDIELILLPEPDIKPVRADPGHIEQVLLNITVNARDAMPHGGKLTIRTATTALDYGYVAEHPAVSPGEYVMIEVTDTGMGMTEDVKRQVFEPFFTTKEVGKGTGLGLSTSYGIVAQVGGHITIESEPGQGATFRIYLPTVEAGAEPLPLRTESGYLPTGNETVLLVEDEPTVRRVASHVLREQGYTVLEAGNGHEALAVLEKQPGNPVDLLLTDVVMPLMGGRELAERVGESQHGIKVLYTSGYIDEVLSHPGIVASDADFTPKPESTEGHRWTA